MQLHRGAATQAQARPGAQQQRSSSMAFRSTMMGSALNRGTTASVVGRRQKASVQKSRTSALSVKAILEKSTVDYVDTSRAATSSVLAIILGGGAGTRLYPLTKQRAKPAVPIGGAYRLIDVPMSNCINSGISKIYILTQFNSTSLNRHLARTYNMGSGVRFGGDGFVEVLAATQTPTDKEWFQGTADAVRQYAWLLDDTKNRSVRNVVILSGDHLYRMDYMRFVQHHAETGADVTIGCIPYDESRASDFGLMKIDGEGRVTEFAEKPKGDALKAMAVDTRVLGLSAEEAKRRPYIASMGIYVFKKEALIDLLDEAKTPAKFLDFGGEIIPYAAANGLRVQAYGFDDYWEDIGTIRSFFEENLKLASTDAPFAFFDPRSPIYTSPRFLPPAKIENCDVREAIISHGCTVEDSTVDRAVVGLRLHVGKNCLIRNAMLIGADYYESDEERAAILAAGGVPLGVGDGSTVENAIVDKNARIGRGVRIVNKDGVQEADREAEGYIIRSGIVVVMRNATIKDGTVI